MAKRSRATLRINVRSARREALGARDLDTSRRAAINTGMIDPATVRATLARLASEHDESLASLSKRIGRNPAYLQQFIARGTPVRLDEADRLTLARHFAVDERMLGARDPWTPDNDT